MTHETYDQLKRWLEVPTIRNMISTALKSEEQVDGWINAALAAVGTDAAILDCKTKSILGAMIEASSMGLRFEGPLGEVYLTDRTKKRRLDDGTWEKEKEAQLGIGYRGLMKLARRDPRVRKIESILVYEADHFEHQLGTKVWLEHTWDVRKPRGEPVAVYAAIRYNDGFYDFGQPFPFSAVVAHRNRILADRGIIVEERGDQERFVWRKSGQQVDPYRQAHTPWIAYLEGMAMVTAVRWASKYWDLTPDFDRATALISVDEQGRSQGLESLATPYVQDEEPKEEKPSTLRDRSLLGSKSLRDKMLGEIRGQGDNEGPPEEEPPREEPPPDGTSTDNESAPDNHGMTEEEKAEAKRIEEEEAKRFEEEKQRELEEAAGVVDGAKPRRGGRRGKGR